MYYRKKPKWQQKEYIPKWIDELIYKPMKRERDKERLAKQRETIKEMLSTGLLTQEEYNNSLARIEYEEQHPEDVYV